MKTQEIIPNLAALIYYDTAKPKDGRKKITAFEKIEADERKPYLDQAEKIIMHLDKLNLRFAPKQDPEKAAQIDYLFKKKIESTVNEFFDAIKVWRKNLIPKEELIQKIYLIWRNL
jgi:hypothetical protein